MPLIDRIRLALAADPTAPLSRVCLRVGDSRPELVATLMQMVTLAGARANLDASSTTQFTHNSTVAEPGQRHGSLPASRRVQERP